MSQFIKGTCADMCPAQERILREKEGLLNLLELPQGTRLHPPPKADPKLTVKSFSRSAAGQHTPRPEELRSPAVLHKTVQHLLTNIVPRDDLDWCVVYDFVFDRLRAVRQDLVVQGLDTRHSIAILEPIIRFHSYAGYRLCEETLSKFDANINRTHLLECLKRLLVLYDELDLKDQQWQSRAEMEALYLLVGLGNSHTLTRALQLPSKLRQHPVLKTAFAMSLALWQGNYLRTCALMSQLPVLLMCVAAQHLPAIRRHALQVMSCAYNSSNLTFPLSKLRTLLLYQTNKQTENECEHYGITVKNDVIIFKKTAFKLNIHDSYLRVLCVDEALKSSDLPQLLLHSCCKDL